MEMDTSQIKGVDSTKRVTKATLKESARLVIKEKYLLMVIKVQKQI